VPQPDFNRRFGLATFPTDSTAESTLTSLDPARDIFLAVLKAAINYELGGRWQAAASDTQLVDTEPVQSSHPQEPDRDYMREVKVSFPALFLHREGDSEIVPFSLSRQKVTQKWQVHWILGPLGAANRRKLTDAFPFVAKLIAEVVEQGGHPAYAVEGSGQRALRVLTEDDYCGFASARFVSSQSGAAGFADEAQSPPYWSLTAEIETTEITGFADSTYGTYPLNVEWNLGTGNADAEDDGIIEDLFRAESDEEPDPED
jgi:hypothetical protein